LLNKSVNPSPLDAMMGKARCHELRGEIPQALDVLNKVIIEFEWYTAALCERARLHMMQVCVSF
jgi:hypothetical protein